MNILVTGNMGYVGPSVVRKLRASWPDARILGADMGLFAHCLTGAETLPERLLDAQAFADVRDTGRLPLEGIDVVVQLAAISNDPIGNRYEAVTHAINHQAAVDVARAARDLGAKGFVFASSCSVYGAGGDAPRDESSAVEPLTAYAKSKVAAERDLAELADDDFSVTCLRFATACGMSDRLRLDLVLNDFVASAISTGTIDILSDGSPWRPLIHVTDMARAIDWAVARSPEDAGPYVVVNAGRNDFNVQVRQLAEAVAERIPGVDVSVNSNASPDKRSYRVSFDRFAELAPDHQPLFDLTAAVADVHAGLTRMDFSDPDFRQSPLARLQVLERLREEDLLDADVRWTRAGAVAGVPA